MNDEIVGGLISALARKETLEKAMMTFYNAGYEKDEIEESARDVYDKVGSKAMGINGSLQEALNDIATKAGANDNDKAKEPAEQAKEEVKDEKLNIQPIPKKEEPKSETPSVPSKQVVSIYGSNEVPSSYQNPDELTNKIQEALRGLQPVNIPSKIEIVHKNEGESSIVQHVSGYEAPRTASKAVTYILIFILIILLGALVAVFLFKDDLIKLFNEIGIG